MAFNAVRLADSLKNWFDEETLKGLSQTLEGLSRAGLFKGLSESSRNMIVDSWPQGREDRLTAITEQAHFEAAMGVLDGLGSALKKVEE